MQESVDILHEPWNAHRDMFQFLGPLFLEIIYFTTPVLDFDLSILIPLFQLTLTKRICKDGDAGADLR